MAMYRTGGRNALKARRIPVHSSDGINGKRRIEQKRDPSLKGLRWALVKDGSTLTAAQRTGREGPPPHGYETHRARGITRSKRCEMLTCKQPSGLQLLLNR